MGPMPEMDSGLDSAQLSDWGIKSISISCSGFACATITSWHTSHLTVIPRTRVGYELLDSGRGAEHRVGYHKLLYNISNKRAWNNCFIKYQILNFIYVEIINVNPCKDCDCILLKTASKAEFRGQFQYLDKLQDIWFMPWVGSQSDYQKFNIQCLVLIKANIHF